jgi:CelD/BcsL family acetyltransferase involved in cellulose biosynthesis
VKVAIPLGSFLALTACAESRYRSNLQHAPLTRWTHLSRSDYEQVVRIVSYSTQQPIIGITTDHARSDSTHLHVITGYPDSEIVEAGAKSIVTTPMRLNLERQRKNDRMDARELSVGQDRR